MNLDQATSAIIGSPTSILDEPASRAVLRALGIPVVEAYLITDLVGFTKIPWALDYPVTLKPVAENGERPPTVDDIADRNALKAAMAKAVATHTLTGLLVSPMRSGNDEVTLSYRKGHPPVLPAGDNPHLADAFALFQHLAALQVAEAETRLLLLEDRVLALDARVVRDA